MENMAVKQLEGRIREVRQNQYRNIEAKRNNLNLLLRAIQDFSILIASRSDLEDAAVLNSLVSETITNISAALSNSEPLERRMKREHLNIVVAGAARQGKSQMLRMLSGVDADLIPTGDTTFCTAAQSRITNDSTKKIRIHFLSQEKFLEKKVYPYYQGSTDSECLGLSPKPLSLQDFIDNDLPEMPKERRDAKKEKHYENLTSMHKTLRERAESITLCLNGETREVSSAELKPYITKDDFSAIPLYLAVDYVEIHTQFPNSLTEGTTLIDLPGVSEMGPNIRENMKNTIRDDADIVLMMKLPSPSGDGFVDYDYELFRMMEQIFPHLNHEIKYQDWLAVIVNERTTGNGTNTRQVEALLQQGKQSSLPQLIRCDCGSPKTVEDMLKQNLDALLKKTEKLDEAWCKKFIEDHDAAISKAKELYSHLSNASGRIVEGFDYKGHIEDFRSDLIGPMQGELKEFYCSLQQKLRECLVQRVQETFSAITEKYMEISKSNVNAVDEIFPIFTVERLLKLVKGGKWGETIEKAGHQQRWAIVTLIRHHVGDIWDGEVTRVCLTELLKKMDENNAITMFCGPDWCDKEDPEAQLSFLQQKLASQMDEGKVKNLTEALETLLSFKISANGNVLPYFVNSPHFKQLDPNVDGPVKILGDFIETYKNKQKYEEFAKDVFNTLQRLTESVFKGLEQQDDIILGNILQVLEANVKMFILQFYFSETVDDEWESVVRTFAPEMWPEEFASVASQSELGKKWQKLLSEIRPLIQ